MSEPTWVVHALNDPGGDFDFAFFCPGCECGHGFNAEKPHEPRWQFNHDMIKPTLDPSLLIRYGGRPGDKVCHSFVRDGSIQFLGDCTHKLAGQTVALEPF